MDLTKLLKKRGFDLINGPIRDHRLLQLWLKKPAESPELYFSSITDIFKSSTRLVEKTDPSLNIVSSDRNEYSSNAGIKVMEDLLKAIGLNEMGISSKIRSAKNVAVSYDNSETRTVDIGVLEQFLYTAAFEENPALLRNLNLTYVLVISGIVYAKNLFIEIESDSRFDSSLNLGFQSIAGVDVSISLSGENRLIMQSGLKDLFPVAVKANRIDFDRGRFDRLRLITDDFNIF